MRRQHKRPVLPPQPRPMWHADRSALVLEHDLPKGQQTQFEPVDRWRTTTLWASVTRRGCLADPGRQGYAQQQG